MAQYFGANTNFETLTYNAYGIGAEVNGGSHENIINYITVHDLIYVLPGSEMIGRTYILQNEPLLNGAEQDYEAAIKTF